MIVRLTTPCLLVLPVVLIVEAWPSSFQTTVCHTANTSIYVPGIRSKCLGFGLPRDYLLGVPLFLDTEGFVFVTMSMLPVL